MTFSFFKKFKTSLSQAWRRQLMAQGIFIDQAQDGTQVPNELLPAYLAQLIDDGFAQQNLDGEVILPWDSFYQALRSPGYDDLFEVLKLPSFTSRKPALQSRNSLTDPDFSIVVADWHIEGQRREAVKVTGAMLVCNEQTELMRPEQWELFSEVVTFAQRPPEQHDENTHRLAWGRIRILALKADARLDDFLHRSVVLTPERLDIELRKSAHIAEDSVIEIEPTFAGAPPDWLERFDNARKVLDRYDIVTPEGIVQVLITPQVKTVLQEIKRLPLRRVAGSRAQAFIINPYAALGPDAKDVIDEEQFENSREQAGLQYERFVPQIERDPTGYPLRVGLLIETVGATGLTLSETQWVTDEDLEKFTTRLESSLSKGFQLMGWNGYDLELQGESQGYLEELRAALEQRRKPASLVTYAQVHDLSGYSSRIEGIGIEKPYYSPYIALKKEGWFPDNVLPVIVYTPENSTEPVAVPATPAFREQLRQEFRG